MATPTATPLLTYTPLPSTATPARSMTPTSTSMLLPTQDSTFTPTATPTLTPEWTETLPEVPVPKGPDTPFDLDSGSPHGGFRAFTDSCAGCHRSHTNPGPHLQVAWPEEQTCFTCHSVEGVASMDVETAFTSQPNTGTAYYSHPVELTSGVHELSALETSSSYFGIENRHVECVDCHDPHDSGNEEYVPPALQDQVRGAAGVYPLYNGQGAPGDFAWLGRAQYEYQLCFKCHSSYVSQPAYPPAGWDGYDVVMDGLAKLTNAEPEQVLDSRDMALEFNPDNTSFHPVMAEGKNPNIPSDSFVPGWSTDSLVYCSDCHNNPNAAVQGSGPHGSRLHILNEQTGYITVNTGEPLEYSGQEVCFNCHSLETYVRSPSPDNNTNFRRSNRNLHQNHSDDGSCYTCHDSHGSEQLHLINLDASIDNV